MSHAYSQEVLDDLLGLNLCDGQWHLIKITQNTETRVNINLDNMKYRYNAKGRADVGLQTFIADIDHTKTLMFSDLKSIPSFQGCLSKASLNGRNILLGTAKGVKYFGAISRGCINTDVKDLISFTHPSSFLKIPKINQTSLKIKFNFRTYGDRGKLLTGQGENALVFITLDSARIVLKVRIVEGDRNEEIQFEIGEKLSDGNWHSVELTFKDNGLSLRMDTGEMVNWAVPNSLKETLRFQSWLFGNSVNDNFVGCLNNLVINGVKENGKNSSHYGVKLGECKVQNHCFPNPCYNGGVCRVHYQSYICKCSNMYTGVQCTHPLFRSTCQEYVKLGLDSNSSCFVQPEQNATTENKPFQVHCDTSNPRNPATLVANTKTRMSSDHKSLSGFSFDRIDYRASFTELKTLVSASRSCRQFMRVIYNQKAALGINMVFLISAKRNRQPIPFTDYGYLTKKNLLPVVGVQFLKGVSYYLGALECYGTRKPSFPLPSSVNVVNLVKKVCKPWSTVSDKDFYFDEDATPTSTIRTSKYSSSKALHNSVLLSKTPAPAETTVTSHSDVTSMTSLVTSYSDAIHMTSQGAKTSSEQGFLLWYVAIIVVAALIFMLVLFVTVLAKVKRATSKKRAHQKLSITGRLSLSDTGLPESDLWMKVNAAGYDVKTGKITYSEMYGGPRYDS